MSPLLTLPAPVLVGGLLHLVQLLLRGLGRQSRAIVQQPVDHVVVLFGGQLHGFQWGILFVHSNLLFLSRNGRDFWTKCPEVLAQNVESICPKSGQPMKTYCLLQKRPRKALKYGRFRGLIFHASASLFSHVIPLLLPQSSPSAAGGAIPCPAIGEKGPAAYRAGPGFRGGAFRSEGRLQHGIIGQHRLPEVAAQRPRPALLQHIARAIQRQAAHIPVIVGAQPCHQLADSCISLTGNISSNRFILMSIIS